MFLMSRCPFDFHASLQPRLLFNYVLFGAFYDYRAETVRRTLFELCTLLRLPQDMLAADIN